MSATIWTNERIGFRSSNGATTGMFDMIHHSQNATTNATNFNMNKFECGVGEQGHTCVLKYVQPKNGLQMVTAKLQNPRVEIVDTDTYSYMVAQLCYEVGPVAHQQEFVVLTRDKVPPMFVKQRILTTLKSKLGMSNADVQALTKGVSYQCWGADKFL